MTLASIVEKETGRSRRALACRLRLHQPAQEGHAAAVGSDHHLRTVRRQGKAVRPADLPVRSRQADALQHLSSSRACRRRRSPIQAAPHSRRSPIRRRPTISTSLPTVPAGTSLPRRWKSITRTSRAIGRSRRSRRKQPPPPRPPAERDRRLRAGPATVRATPLSNGRAGARSRKVRSVSGQDQARPCGRRAWEGCGAGLWHCRA